MKKEIDMGIFLEDDARYADAVNVFGDIPGAPVRLRLCAFINGK